MTLDPPSITYAPASAGALRCSLCGALVDDDRGHVAADDHTAFHALLSERIDGLAVRLAELDAAPALRGIGLGVAQLEAALRVQAGRPPALPGWGDIPAGHVRLTLDGARDQVRPAVDGLAYLVPLSPVSPIVCDDALPVQEQRAYLVDVDMIRSRVARFTAASQSSPTPERIPAPSRIKAGDAAVIARHARAISLHLRELWAIIWRDGAPVTGGPELADFLANVGESVAGLDTWAESTAHKSEAPRDLLADTIAWCHAPGGVLPFDAGFGDSDVDHLDGQ